MSEKTHFGYKNVSPEEKTANVNQVFHSVAKKYDIMNDCMSLGMHRLWKRFAIQALQLRPSMQVLDLAGGTGDLTRLIAPKIAPGQIWLADINMSMLQVGRDRLSNHGNITNLNIIQVNAEELPFAPHSLDRIIIGFGLRNVTDKERALKSMFECLKPGGMALILEFSKPVTPALSQLYDAYSFNILPKLGHLITKDRDSYQYLVESIRMHPNQKTLQNMMQQAGFERCDYHNLVGGIVAVHKGYKL